MTAVHLSWREGDTHITHADIYSWTVEMFGLPVIDLCFIPQVEPWSLNLRTLMMLYYLH